MIIPLIVFILLPLIRESHSADAKPPPNVTVVDSLLGQQYSGAYNTLTSITEDSYWTMNYERNSRMPFKALCSGYTDSRSVTVRAFSPKM